jgi:phage terminase large subunit-like protein
VAHAGRGGIGERQLPSKDKSTERIDGIVAIIMAIGRAMVLQEEPQPSYEMFIL